MKNNYNNEKIIGLLNSKGYTNFLTQIELASIKNKLHKNEYKIYELYEDSSKVIVYKKTIPKIKLLKINSKVELNHREILGTVFSLGLKEDTFGDIVRFKGSFYIFILPELVNYITYNLNTINNNPVSLEEIDIEFSSSFKQEYIKKEFIVSSLRIDNVISTIINTSRNSIIDKFKNKEVILNYKEELKPTRILKENDVFSIRRYGKYKFNGVLKTTKKGGFIIEIYEYK